MKIYALTACAAILMATGVRAAPDPVPRDVLVDWSVKVPMRDGVTLNANVFRPAKSTERLPVVLTVTPYTADTLQTVGMWFARHGYVYAAVDTRGRGESGGAFLPTTHEAEDGYDAIEWLAHRPYADGRVVGWGGSYAGRNQIFFAALAPPSLKAIAPASAGMTGIDRDMRANIPFPQLMQWLAFIGGSTSNRSAYTDPDYWHGALAELAQGKVSFRQFDSLVNLPNPMWQDNLRHPTLDSYWQSTTTDAGQLDAAQLGRIRIPMLAITGDYDPSQTGLRAYADGHVAAVPNNIVALQYLVMGPWDHGGTRDPKRITGGVDMGAASVVDMLDLHRQWYDWILGRGPKPAFLGDHFVYYLAGAGVWRTAPSLAAASALLRTLSLSSPTTSANAIIRAGALASKAPRQTDDHYTYDPSVPGRNEGVEGYELFSTNWLTDDDAVTRLDGEGLIYQTEPFARPMDLIGIPAAELDLTMDVPDTDIRVALYAVMPDGKQLFLDQDQVRARYRTSLERETLVPAGKRLRYDFHRFDFIARRLPAGVRLRLVISPLGLSIYQERNRNSGKPVADENVVDNRVAHVALSMGTGLSRIHLPIVPAEEDHAN